ncbi:uncharacterized protein LOC135382955 [Ornithodoros turicata]|uniref:uncharacterized protein LOC135382955 n=1 Tax=Ornithodoros turicata TaxID=34597 RepID=UPI0031394377
MYKHYSSGQHCAVFGCKNNQRKRKLLLEQMCEAHNVKRSSCMCGVYSLHRFPAAPERRREWVVALNRKGFEASKYARVCSIHFVDGKPTERNPCPMLQLGSYAKKVSQSIATVVDTTTSPAPASGEQQSMWADDSWATDVEAVALDLSTCDHHDRANSRTNEKCDQASQAEPSVCSVGVQWEDPCASVLQEHSYATLQVTTVCAETQSMQEKSLTEGLSESVCHFYTGLSLDAFSKLVTTVSLAACISGSLSTGDQVLLTLMRLRLGLLYYDLAIRFGISVARAGRVFRKILLILDNIMRNVVVWLPLETIFATTPFQFSASGYANTTCIIDCTEVQMQRPKKIYARGQSYSHYKGCNTVKCLVAIAPSGFIMFVSNAYGGRASDKFIVDDSQFSDYLYENQEIMADRGFALTASMKEKGVKLNMPAFSKGRHQFPEMEATVSRRISQLRIHVERAINRIKTYRILKSSLPIHHKKLMDSIILVCAGLCNLKGQLIAPKNSDNKACAQHEESC